MAEYKHLFGLLTVLFIVVLGLVCWACSLADYSVSRREELERQIEEEGNSDGTTTKD